MLNNNNFWGMNFIWWFIWMVMIFWIFAIPYDIPGQRKRKDSPLDILQKRYASGEISKDEYQERKATLIADSAV
jgi:putative membrane protein